MLYVNGPGTKRAFRGDLVGSDGEAPGSWLLAASLICFQTTGTAERFSSNRILENLSRVLSGRQSALLPNDAR